MPDVTMEDRAHALENEYFRRQEQELIEKMRSRLASESKEASTRPCPKCESGKLIETAYENVKIDVCNNCHGVWLDAGELAQILHKDEGKGWFGRLIS
jgi:ribosomal protein L31